MTKADDELRAAVDAVARERLPELEGLLTDFVVTLAIQSFDEDGQDATCTMWIASVPVPSTYKLRGLLEMTIDSMRP